MTKRIQLVYTANPLPRGKEACDFCLFNRSPIECAKPEYDGCVVDRNSYYAEVDDEPSPAK